MPAMANITVKKADGTTDIVYSGISPSAGDTVPALWRCEAVSTAAGLRPTLQMLTKWNGPRTARRMEASFQYPEIVTDSVTSVSRVRNRIPVTISAVIPVEVPDSVVNEAVAQAFNLVASALFKSSTSSGFAPT